MGVLYYRIYCGKISTLPQSSLGPFNIEVFEEEIHTDGNSVT